MSKKPIGMIFLIILIVAALVILAGELIEDPSGTPKYDLTCNVMIENYGLFNMDIHNNLLFPIECTSKKSSLFAISDYLYDKGQLFMEAQGKRTSVNVFVIEFSRRRYVLALNNLDKGDTVVNFYLYNDNNQVIDSESINFYVGGE